MLLKYWTFRNFYGIIVYIRCAKENINFGGKYKMFNEEIFNLEMDNIKNDLAIEGMEITEQDINLYRKFANEEMDMPQLIEIIKNQVV